MATSIDLEPALRELLPASRLQQDHASYAIDGLTPSLVVRPASPEEIASVLAAADRSGAAVVPRGGGSQLELGMPLSRYDLALDVRDLDGIIEYEPADLTITVQAGMTLKSLQERLSREGQWLPLDPPLLNAATIGGTLATNVSGPGRVAYGTARDLLIGIGVVTAQGNFIKSGGRVVKNVAGYDMGKLFIGSLGTLGVIVQASFKVSPLPEQSLTLAVTTPDSGPLLGLAGMARQQGLAVNGLAVTRQAGGPAWTLLTRLAGGVAAVDRSRGELESLASARGLSLVEADGSAWGQLPAFAPAPELRIRASVMPTAVATLLGALAKLGASVVAYPTAGIVYGSWATNAVRADSLAELRRLCVTAGRGAMVVESAPLEIKRNLDVWGETRPDFAIMQRLKSEFDPNGVLNPGRYLGGI